MNKKIIFHLPFKILTNHASGTQIRPMKMKRAFEELGYHVDVVTGSGKDRMSSIEQLKKKIRQGEKYAFMYSESSTEPTLLTEPHHLPLYPSLDFNFFKFCKQNNIPIGLFYRDIYWNFPFYGDELPFFKTQIAKFFYRYDLKQYQKYLSVLYLPSVQMLSYIPAKFDMKVAALPPAAEITNEDELALMSKKNNEIKGIHILYVGGVGDLYKLDLLMASVSERPSIQLIVCCRPEEWAIHSHRYEKFLLAGNITIVHKKGEELTTLFEQTNVASIFLEPSEYRNFAMPVKVFEYIQNVKPIISTSKNAVAEIVEKNDIGWSIDYQKPALDNLLDELLNDEQQIKDKAQNILRIIPDNKWVSRAKQVIEDLSS